MHNVKELSEAEVVQLLSEATGRVCGRVYQRSDGTVLTKDCPVGVAKVRRQVAMAFLTVAAIVVAALGLRAKGPSGSTQAGGVFHTDLKSRLVDAKEYLRDTAIFGPIIDRLDPRPIAGEMIAVPPSAPTHPSPAP